MFIVLIVFVVFDYNVGCFLFRIVRFVVTGSCVNDGVYIIRGYSLVFIFFVIVCGDESLFFVFIFGLMLFNFYFDVYITDFGFKFFYRIICE